MNELPTFRRDFFDSELALARIGTGAIGGKAAGLQRAAGMLQERFGAGPWEGITIDIPRMVVITTELFEEFMAQNSLREIALSGEPDDRIAHAFQQGSLPSRLVGDLRAIATQLHAPLAVRSSSLLEDAMYRPFAGVYGTKMIPNNEPSPDARYRRLVEAIKFVYASTFFRSARAYLRSLQDLPGEERMAIIIQEVVGERIDRRFYPTLSGVARSYNFYPTGHARPEHGVVDLALGLGKTIVDGGLAWSFSPAFPKAPPPFNSIKDMLRFTQTSFWAVNMGRPPAHDPIREAEYLVQASLADAEYDDTLRFLASTYDSASDRLIPGTNRNGPRLLDFAPILRLRQVRLTDLVKELLKACEEELEAKVEIEFAVALNRSVALPARFGFLQVRPMVVSEEVVDLPEELHQHPGVVIFSESALGNGVREDIRDIVYLRPGAFETNQSHQIAQELAEINTTLTEQQSPYLLIGFGRWGTSDHTCGIPVEWGQIAAARVIVEVGLPGVSIDLSQGSHFFHNVTSLRVLYLSIPSTADSAIDWRWLEAQEERTSTERLRHVRLATPLSIRVDGRTKRGVILSHA